ncbi:nuclear transport factor 2 family protein [Litoreibacter roseus]|uniref:SnoaL-like domain-containing protein n=1 Tax=Litoreibacter roseus TaxID=2601869 RepID=A0A6N6JL85_9RHOB|nr:nuclear transport factor 2 family protein [Litoreibacter roseus]GFE67076.1 hypothetical protein KIN_41500 [Litoreibacter roseus]
MNQDLQYLLDRRALDDLMAGFSDAANRFSPEDFRRLWADDATWTIGPPVSTTFTGADDIVAAFSQLVGNRWKFFLQMPSAANVVDIQGDRATGRAYTNEIAQANDGSGNYNFALYEDEMVKIDGKWRFASRNYKVLYLDQTPLAGEGF